MSNELFRTLFMAAVLVLIMVSTYSAWQLAKVSESLDEIKPQIEYCIWRHENHNTKVVKGSAIAKELASKFRRESDEGGCR